MNALGIRGLDYVVTYVHDLDSAVVFYRDTLGLTNTLFKPELNWAEFEVHPITLVLFAHYPEAPLRSGSGGTALALAVEDLHSTLQKCIQKGIEPQWGPHGLSECSMAMISDPDGNPLFLHQRKALPVSADNPPS